MGAPASRLGSDRMPTAPQLMMLSHQLPEAAVLVAVTKLSVRWCVCHCRRLATRPQRQRPLAPRTPEPPRLPQPVLGAPPGGLVGFDGAGTIHRPTPPCPEHVP